MIGRLGRSLGLSLRAIRFYEERGLIQGARDRIGRRVYDRRACGRLQLIALLRSADVSLRQLAQILRLEDGEARRRCVKEVLANRRADLAAKVARLDEVALQLEAEGLL